jgi:hypothetical protein
VIGFQTIPAHDWDVTIIDVDNSHLPCAFVLRR